MRNIIYIFALIISQTCFSQSEIQTELISVEGFYFSDFEKSSFMEIDFNNSVIICEHWTEFLKGLEIPEDNISNGIYIKINAVKKTGKTSYGHLGAWTSEILVTEIIQIDPNRTFVNYIKDHKLKRVKSK